MAVITISRQYGSGGDEIAARLCNVLGYHYFDKRLMAQVATEAGLSPSEVVDFSEDNYKVRSFLERLFGRHSSRVVAPSGWGTGDPTRSRIEFLTPMGIYLYEAPREPAFREVAEPDEAKRIALIEAVIRVAYQHGNIVILGRGGQAILKDKPDVLHVRIVAPLDTRVQRLHKQQNVSLSGAQDVAIQRDRASAEYLRRFYDLDWADPVLYDLVINTTQLGLEGATQLIVDAVERLPVPTPASLSAHHYVHSR
jgi:CMP/dCMP kinase